MKESFFWDLRCIYCLRGSLNKQDKKIQGESAKRAFNYSAAVADEVINQRVATQLLFEDNTCTQYRISENNIYMKAHELRLQLC